MRFYIPHNLVPLLTASSSHRGAKTAMTLALRSPENIANIVAVDNAPVDVALNGDFSKYIRGMKKIDEANITRQGQADIILQPYEEA